MKKYKVEINTEVKGQKNVDKLNDSLEDTQKEQENVNDGFSEMGGAADAAVGGAVSKFKGLKTGIVSAVKSLGVLKVAVAATGLGLFLLIIASIKAAFTSSEEGQNKFSKWMNALGVITGNLMDLLADLGNVIISAFENPKESINTLWELIKTNFVNRVEAIPELFAGIFKTVVSTFSFLGGKIKQIIADIPIIGKGIDTEAADKQVADSLNGMKEGAIDTGKALVKMGTGIEADDIIKFAKDTVDAIGDIIEETEREIAISNELSDTQARLDKMIRVQLVERARLQGIASDAMLAALDVDKYTSEQRLVFLKNAEDATDQIFAKEQEIAAERLRIKQEQNKLSGSTKDDLLEEAQLEADLIRITKERADAQRRIFTQQLTARREFMEERSGLDEEDFAGLQEDIDAEIAAMQTGEDEKIVMWENTAKAKQEIDASTLAATLGATAGLFSALADMSGENFEQQKKFKIAEAVTNGIAGSIGAYTGAFASIPNPIAAAIIGTLMALTVQASTIMQISKIKSTTPNSGGGGSFSAPSMPTTTAPSLSLISPATQGESNISDQLGATQEPINAYVVSTDMSSQQQLDRRIETQATI